MTIKELKYKLSQIDEDKEINALFSASPEPDDQWMHQVIDVIENTDGTTATIILIEM